MSSIRPLATITILAAAGIFLYLKINETEPVIPAEVAGFQIDGGLEFDSDFEAMPDFSTEAGQLEAAAPGGSAPSFSAPDAGASVAATEVSTPPVVEAAPSFETSATPEALAEETSPVGASVPDLPPLPALPPEVPPPATAPTTVETTPPVTTPPQVAAQASLFSATRIAVEAALDRGQLSQALLLLSDWYGDPSLSPAENQEVGQLLGQLAGSVIYSTEHRLEPPYMVQAGERLQDIATRYEVPWQLLAKINGITDPDQLVAGQQLKVLRGPFSAMIDLSKRNITLMLNRRYAGQFSIEVDPISTVEEGHWSVSQKLLTPGNVRQAAATPVTPTEERSMILTNSSGGTNQLVIIRASNAAAATATDPTGRVIRLTSTDVGDVYDILSLGSQVVIRR